MKKVIKLVIQSTVALLAVPSMNVFAAEHYAYVIDSSYTVQLVSMKGVAEAQSKPDFALNVSSGGDGSVWIVSTDSGKADRGGNLLKVRPNGSTEWKTVKIEGGVEVSDVSGDYAGNAYVVDGATQEILHVTAAGKILSQGNAKGPFFDVSASFSEIGPAENLIAAIGSEPDAGIGNPVYFFKSSKTGWKPRGVGAKDVTGYWIVTASGQVKTAAPDNPIMVKSPENTASSISVSKSGLVWILSQEPNINKGGAYLKVWDGKGADSSNWIKVPKIGAYAVSAR
ncbi:hypothetical protein [Arenicella xantha]|uniref:Uncharacterized protein n=1 Tax=Arenicella xantha TaxID=644221 RepID=A0A395JGV5_9GAMM|nr:hypothetical protein [Arenicella xantha]RBP48759.1 hypothetical protein DFR28_10598 [Arenicella xantha]